MQGARQHPKHLVGPLQPYLLQQDPRHNTYLSPRQLLPSSSAHPYPGLGEVLEVHKVLEASLHSWPTTLPEGLVWMGGEDNPSMLRGESKKDTKSPGHL